MAANAALNLRVISFGSEKQFHDRLGAVAHRPNHGEKRFVNRYLLVSIDERQKVITRYGI
jgi:hypothetical protein